MLAVRFDIVPLALDLAEATGIAFVLAPNAKAACSEDHPLFRGIYAGKLSPPGLYDLVQS
jgi:TPP-dependent 2-oxoacid decarboxylase